MTPSVEETDLGYLPVLRDAHGNVIWRRPHELSDKENALQIARNALAAQESEQQ